MKFPSTEYFPCLMRPKNLKGMAIEMSEGYGDSGVRYKHSTISDKLVKHKFDGLNERKYFGLAELIYCMTFRPRFPNFA